MTGNNSTRKKLRAALLAFVMVTSVFAGTVAFSGSVAADVGTSSNFADNAATGNLAPGQSGNISYLNIQNSSDQLNVTTLRLNVSSGTTASDITEIRLYNTSSGSLLGSTQSISTSAPNAAISLNNGNGLLVGDGSQETKNITVGITVNDTVSGENPLALKNASVVEEGSFVSPISGGANSDSVIDVGTITVNKPSGTPTITDNKTTFNVSVTTPAASSNDVNASSIDLTVTNRNVSEDTVVVKNGQIVNGTGSVSTSNGDVTVTTDVALKEGNYTISTLSAADSQGNSIPYTIDTSTNDVVVEMSGAQYKVIPDQAKFINSDNTVSNDEGADVAVVVQDKFGHNLTVAENDVNAYGNDTTLLTQDSSVSIKGPFNGTAGSNPSNYENKPVQGNPIYFNVSNTEAGDVSLSASDISDSNGHVNTASGTQTFTAPVEGVTVTAADGSLMADDQDTENVTLQLTGPNGNAVKKSGVSVSWSVDNSSAASVTRASGTTTSTDSNGQATLEIKASNSDVTLTVRGIATVNGNNYFADATVDTTPGQPSNLKSSLQFKGSSGSTSAEVASSGTLLVDLEDDGGNAISGTSVSFSSNAPGVSFASASGTTNASGQFATTVTLPNGTQTLALNASSGTFNASATGNARVNVTTTPAAFDQLRFKQGNPVVPSGSSTTVTVETLDKYGNLNTSAQPMIKLSTSDQTVINVAGSASQSESTTQDAGNANATFTINANATSGSATLTANATGYSNVSDTSTSASIGTAQSINVYFAHDVSTSSGAQDTSTMYAQLLDGNGNPISINNENITFAVQSGNGAVLSQMPADFTAQTNSTGVAQFQVNATSNTGDTTFYASAENFSAEGTGTVTTTGPATSISVSPSTSTVTTNTSVNITISYTDSQGQMVPKTTKLDVKTDLGAFSNSNQKVTVSPSLKQGSGASATVTLNSSTAGTANLSGIGGGVTGTATVTYQQPAGPVNYDASVTFNDTTVTSGTETVTVDSASYTADGSAADYVVVVHAVNNDGSTGEIVGYSANQSGSAEDISVDLNASNAQGDALDSITSDTKLRAMLHQPAADSAYGSAIQVDGSQVTDDANITVQSVPTDPTERALQIAGVESASELTQNDVTIAITQFERDNNVNNVDIKQDDVTTIITLFERAN